jgi:squalene-associated FAD-dependent desaturase
MGCCTNLEDFCRRLEIDDCIRRDEVLTFIGPAGRQHRFQAARWLPAPLHLGPAFFRLSYLSLRDRVGIGRALWALMRLKVSDDCQSPTIGRWLSQRGQSAAAIQHFWSVVLTSALGESLDRASLAAARKVLVDGFLAAPGAYALEIPQVPLGVLYGARMQDWLTARGVELHFQSPIRRIERDEGLVAVASDGRRVRGESIVVALPWSKMREVFSHDLAEQLPWLDHLQQFESAPITAVHLWFDRPIMALPHAVLVGRLSQWVFNRAAEQASGGQTEFYYQVVISASRELAGRDRDSVIDEVRGELAAIWPAAASAHVLRARVVTEQASVFSARPGLESLRPPQRTAVPGLFVAGDWTATGWPSTMESAVRSGYLAAEGILESLGRPQRLVADDLPRGRLARWLIAN